MLVSVVIIEFQNLVLTYGFRYMKGSGRLCKNAMSHYSIDAMYQHLLAGKNYLTA